MNEVNKTFENPERHIHVKYYNKNSPYYIEDMTKAERDIASHQEYSYLRNNKLSSYNSNDAVLRDRAPVFFDVEIAERKAYNREKVNEQFKQLLQLRGIEIEKDEKLTFTIDPYRYKVTVNGTEDESLKKKIEEVLETAENSRELFYHIVSSLSADSSQYSTDKSMKQAVIRAVSDATGYYLNELNVVDGRFVTEKGEDVFEIFEKSIKEDSSIPEFSKGYIITGYKEDMDELAQRGIDNVGDLVLSIEYENGSFYDIAQSENFGTGKTDWIEQMQKAKIIEYEKNKRTEEQDTEIINSDKFTYKEVQNKLIKEILEITGYDLNNLERKDGRFLTGEKEDIFEIYKKELLVEHLIKELEESKIDYYGEMLKRFAKEDNFFIGKDEEKTISLEKDTWIDNKSASFLNNDIYG
ncbi:hypothetical protein CP965_13570 [Halarcobacter mediterraneus]|uniref:DUF4885 domain-containing protein n=1 Tax=Halarcobacter mediterraneus TaxID=2023153 RepID=A0A4Q1AQA7_9BACT|nr:DUF4885 family protein [Halarcobacter mediterraneus]RXK11564.1 hypothetical protein CP965_13570 [Halarcobacter mediterraneus]